MKKKFLDPNLKNKSKTVESNIQLFNYKGDHYPLPTEIEISGREFVIENAHFVQEAIHLLFIKRIYRK